MHSPGGIPGVSPAVTWNATAAERAWSVEVNPLMRTAAIGILSLTAVGAAYRAGILSQAIYQATRPHWWGLYNIYQEQADIRHALKGGKFRTDWSLTSRPIGLKGFMHRIIPVSIPFPWIDFQGVHTVEESSSHGLVQNGGSSAPPLYISKRAIQRKLESRKGSTTNSAHGFRSGKAPTRRKRCPPGHRWNGRRCVPSRKR